MVLVWDGTEGMYRFPAGASVASGQGITVALKATGFFALYGFNPVYEVIDTDPAVPNVSVYSTWSSGAISLANTGDEMLLLNGSGVAVDVVTYAGVTPSSRSCCRSFHRALSRKSRYERLPCRLCGSCSSHAGKLIYPTGILLIARFAR